MVKLLSHYKFEMELASSSVKVKALPACNDPLLQTFKMPVSLAESKMFCAKNRTQVIKPRVPGRISETPTSSRFWYIEINFACHKDMICLTSRSHSAIKLDEPNAMSDDEGDTSAT